MLQKMSDTIKFLCADMVQTANSGHPGAPMGLSDVLTVLSSHLKHNPKNPNFLNRDRLVFSGGHASSLLYSMLHLWGYDISLDDLKNFRQLHSITPGHPEYKETPGVEITTGPLGQGVANAVGFSMASKYAKTLLNKDSEIIDHNVYCLCGDGDLQEGISYEAIALAGHHKLDNLVLIYDSNNITIEGDTSIAWSEDVKQRFNAASWNVLEINGHNFEEIDQALASAKSSPKPVLLIAHTLIAKGSASMEGSHKTHGAPLGNDELSKSKKLAGFNPDASFAIDDDVLIRFRSAIEKGDMYEKLWNNTIKESKPETKELLSRLQSPDFSNIKFPEFKTNEKLATRASNGQVLNAISDSLEGFLGGSADLAPSNNTELKGKADFPVGPNMHFGIREHAMAAICNAMSIYGLFIPYSGTFFIFSDYMKNSVRLSALMGLRSFYIWTHDSIGVGEDGPTHQPIEQLSTFRAMPNFYTFRPADANENVECWKIALSKDSTPCGFALSRQGLPTIDSKKTKEASKGGYLLENDTDATITLIATGSEVELALNSAKELRKEGKKVNVVSVPCFELFCEQSKEYQQSIINPNTKRVAIEAASGLEWYRFADEVIGMTTFGASAPGNDLFNHFGFTVENVIKTVNEL
ncbi:MAG: Transketolase (EC [uncultured Campylobacterales bacterium]|uniref:Transketolase n=1 Tax=uncultured Campylobacterales bacterium TaxID=352960 RepID=A0A6S6SE47_9BACT|nr:MAG: Transketolase (EC [uncultured Campylobacterales bacterium]